MNENAVDWPRLSGLPFSYAERCGTAKAELPAGYHHTRRTMPIGYGRQRFEMAAAELMRWRMQRGAGVRLQASTRCVEQNTLVTVGFGPLTGACRVVYLVDEDDRRGFAYGTLTGHPESGEEYFGVTFDRSDETVYAQVTAFSRPGRWWVRAVPWVARAVQQTITDRYLVALRS